MAESAAIYHDGVESAGGLAAVGSDAVTGFAAPAKHTPVSFVSGIFCTVLYISGRHGTVLDVFESVSFVKSRVGAVVRSAAGLVVKQVKIDRRYSGTYISFFVKPCFLMALKQRVISIGLSLKLLDPNENLAPIFFAIAMNRSLGSPLDPLISRATS